MSEEVQNQISPLFSERFFHARFHSSANFFTRVTKRNSSVRWKVKAWLTNTHDAKQGKAFSYHKPSGKKKKKYSDKDWFKGDITET